MIVTLRVYPSLTGYVLAYATILSLTVLVVEGVLTLMGRYQGSGLPK